MLKYLHRKKRIRNGRNRLQRKSENKKVRNATPSECDGIKFRSKLEVVVYKLLKEANITAGYETEKFILMPSFRYGDENMTRAITWTPDFIGNGFIIECKGFANETFPIKLKLFKYTMSQNNVHYDIYIVHNQREAKEAVQKIKNKLQ